MLAVPSPTLFPQAATESISPSAIANDVIFLNMIVPPYFYLNMLASANERDYNIDILNCKEANYKK